ncbi:MAG: hypothetical protein H5T78_22420 [Nocardia sp.]|nr:hypothetical protein [Nocardia sp.]
MGVVPAVRCGLSRVRARLASDLEPVAVRERPVAEAVGATLAVALSTGTAPAGVADAGARISAAFVSAALGADAETATVRGPLRADVVMTGDEIRAVGPLGPGETRDCLGPVMPEFLRACDIESTGLWHLADSSDLLRFWLSLKSHAELVVLVGAPDQLRALLTELGARVIVDGVAIRPGGTTLVAQLPDGRVLLGLPANPFAAVAALLAVGPAIVDALTLRAPGATMWGRLSDAGVMAGEATRLVGVRQHPGGVWRGTGPAHTAHLGGLIPCQALAVLPPGTGRGSLVELLPIPH